eukprot:2540742-Pyramimonas_sp.AAC.1
MFVNEQWGLRKGRSTRDIIFVTRVICELYAEWELRLHRSRAACERAGTWEQHRGEWETEHALFQKKRAVLYLADIKKAYPAVPREPLWDALRIEGLPLTLVAVFRRLDSETACQVKLGHGTSSTYQLFRGLREGCASSCGLFNVYHNYSLRELLDNLPGVRLQCSTRLRCAMGRRPWRDPGAVAQRVFRAMGFADDTSSWTDAQRLEATRRMVFDTLGDRGEEVHPGKGEFLQTGVYDENGELPAGFHRAVRVLGAWVDTDG